MGGGVYSYLSAEARATSYSTYASTDCSYLDREIFTKRSLDEDMNIKGKIRESRDSDEHPNAFPIIIALDVTGSMGTIPKQLITKGFPELMKKIMDNGVEHAQVCFIGVGDNECDQAPIQVGQFETSDELQEKWLRSIYIESGGGPNMGEGYGLVWYVAAKHTSIDSILKHNKKGVLITVGDEPILENIPKRDIESLFGGAQSDVDVHDILEEARRNWNVFHINVRDYSGVREKVQSQWAQLLGENFVNTQSSNGEDVPELIAGIITKCYKENKPTSVIVESTDLTKEHIVEPEVIL